MGVKIQQQQQAEYETSHLCTVLSYIWVKEFGNDCILFLVLHNMSQLFQNKPVSSLH